MQRYDLIDTILNINYDSLKTGKYCRRDNNLIANIEIIMDIYESVMDWIFDNELSDCNYKLKNLSLMEEYNLLSDLFNYFDSLTFNQYKFREKMDMVINDGTLNLDDQCDEWKASYEDEFCSINGYLKYNVSDVVSFVHEFFHLNSVYKNDLDNIVSFSEFISIYFEMLTINYLFDNNIDKEGATYCYLNRLFNSVSNADSCYYELFFLNLYTELKNDGINKFQLKNYSSEEQMFIDGLISGFCRSHVKSPIFKVVDNYPYVLGVVFSNHLLAEHDKISDNTLMVMDLYYNMEDKNFCDVLRNFGFLDSDCMVCTNVIDESLNYYFKSVRDCKKLIRNKGEDE